MKIGAVVLIHGLLWILIFYTFFNILQALSAGSKDSGYNPFSDAALIISTVSTLVMLAVPFYSGYIVTPYLLEKRKRMLVIAIAILSGIIFPITLSIANDGLRMSAVRHFFFTFSFLNLFMILGMGTRCLTDRVIQKLFI